MPEKLPQLEAPGLPYSLEAEVSVLGAVLLNPESLDEVDLRPGHFFDLRHRAIWRAMSTLAAESRPVDLVTVAERLKADGELDNIGGAAYLASLDSAMHTSAGIKDHAEIVIDAAVKRQAISVGHKLIEAARAPGVTAKELIERAERALMAVGDGAQMEDRLHRAKDVAALAIKQVELRAENPGKVTGLPTGLEDLDGILLGMQPADLIIIAARPSMGKTILGYQIAVNAARASGENSLFESIEMDVRQLADRWLTAETRIDNYKIRTGFVQDDWPALTDAAGAMAETPILIDDTPSASLAHIRRQARRVKKAHGLGLVVVDYLQLTTNPESQARKREQEVGEISRGLKALAKELQIPVIALAQLNRGVEMRQNKRPMLADLRESGSIEQDADLVLFIYRDEFYYPDKTESRGIAEIIVGKNRNGPTGKAVVRFAAKHSRFDNLAKPGQGEERPTGPENDQDNLPY